MHPLAISDFNNLKIVTKSKIWVPDQKPINCVGV